MMEQESKMPEGEARKEAEAVRQLARDLAKGDKQPAPTTEHYQEASKSIDAIKALNPDMANRFIDRQSAVSEDERL